MRELVGHGNKVIVETCIGATIDLDDASYRAVGAEIMPDASVFGRAELLVQVKEPQPSEIVVDVSIDQGGCFETSRPTTYSNPTHVVDDVVHCCVTKMPGAVARTSTFALNNATLPFMLALADKGYRGALEADPHLRNGLNVIAGKVTHWAVAAAHGVEFVAPEKALAADATIR